LKRRTVIIAAVAMLGGLACMALGMRTLAAGLVHPVENGARKAGDFVSTGLKGIFAGQAAVARCRELERENDLLRLVRADNENLRAENARLRELAGFEPDGGKACWMPATVLSRDGATGMRRFLRIDCGSRAGVRAGAAVVTPEGLVGRVAEAGPNEAMVVPITDPSVRVACEVKSADPSAGPVYGILYGCGWSARKAERAFVVYAVPPLRLDHVGKISGMSIPDRAHVVTSGLGGVFPKGLAVGRLTGNMRDDDERLEMQGDVAPAVDFTSLKYVFIRRED